ncbi:uncharacterized protein [Prorops nasuta]|uniref:uncharacterized protein n=1 Tax=Prorops nasuta TaxID=863751 RepID=UPI0034CD2E89
MPDTEDNKNIRIDYVKTSWIYSLTKTQLIEALKQLKLEHETNFSIDKLRKILRAHISETRGHQGQQQGEENKSQTRPSVNKKEEVTHKMSEDNNNTKLEFQLGKDDWETYTERLELYFVANDVKADKQAAVLLTKISANTYKLIRDLCAPDKPNTKTFAELQAHQSATESVADFVARLKSLSLNCNFTNAKVALRDQLVCGLKDYTTKKTLFREDKLTYESAYKIAAAIEKAEKNALTTDKIISGSVSSTACRGMNRKGRVRGQHYNKNSSNDDNQVPKYNTQLQSDKRLCYCCGKPNHMARECYHRHNTCNSCKRKGHLAVMCRSQKTAVQHLDRESKNEEQRQEEAVYDFLLVDDSKDEATNNAYEIGNDNVKADPMYLNVIINGEGVNMEIDTGSYVAIISKRDKDKYLPESKITREAPALSAYGKIPLESEGVLKNLKVKLGNREAVLEMRVMKNNGPMLIGRQWLKVFGLWPLPLNLVSKSDDCNKIEIGNITREMLEKYPKLFGPGPGIYNRGKLRLVLKKGHLEKIDVSEWATPIVPVIKADGTVRICDRHPILLIDEIFMALRNGKQFSQIDLEHAYMQIPVEESSRDYLTKTTHKGLYRYTKMTEGIASGPGDFQRKIEQCLAGIEGVIPYLDNIFCTGENEEKHLKTLNIVCKRIEEYGFKVNINKCDFFKEKLDILGFVINKDGLHNSETKVRAIIEAPIPVDKKQLDSILGLITYYARFLPNRATNLKPLYECAKRDNFEWTKECDKAYKWVKKELVSPCVLAHFDPNEEIILSCDASLYELAAILSHRYKDGTERPIAYASKVIPEKELSRAIIDKEASAIVFGFKKYYNYIFGKEILLRTDHKPLVFIFGPKQEIPLTTASRLKRWAYFLSRFLYKIEYVKSEHNGNCDALSRLPIKDSTPIFNNEYIAVNYTEESLETINAVEMAAETIRDKVLSKIIQYVKGTWPNASEMNDYEKLFYTKRDELTVEKDCYMWGYRFVAPESVRKCILTELHASHFGIVKMKMLARSYVW